MNKRKKIKELEAELANKDKQLDEYGEQIKRYKDKIDAITKVEESIPDNCIKGPWCKTCQFVRVFHTSSNVWGFCNKHYICGKGESCPNYIQMEV